MDTIMLKPDGKSQKVPWSFQFWLEESRLLNEAQLDELKKIMVGMDLASVSAWLEREGWLTAYQLRRIQEGTAKGLVLGQYRILDELGEGGFGKVYKAVHGLMNRVAALKVISPQSVQNAEAREVLLRDVVVTTHLVHPNIARAYDANETDGILWFAMEFVDGPNLAEHVQKNGWRSVSVSMACTIIGQVASALQYAHERGLVHRDIKPQNLLLPRANSDGMPDSNSVQVKVVDFGLAKLWPQGSEEFKTLSQDGGFLGTPEYVSPEQARNSRLVDIRSDLYSLGCTFYFLLTGRAPFRGHNVRDCIARHLEGSVEPVQILRPDVPAHVVGIVRRLMARNPDDRYQTPTELIKDLVFGARDPVSPMRGRTQTIQSIRPEDVANDEIVPAIDSAKQPDEDRAPAIESSQGQETLLELWSDWLDLVNTLAEREPAPLNEETYKSLYKRLIARLHSSGGSTEGNEWCGRMEALVEPWVTLSALRRLELKTLIDLRRTALELNAQLSPPAKSAQKWWYFVGLMAATMLVMWLVVR